MDQCRFSTPVLVRLPLASGGTFLKPLNGPHEALHAIHRDGLGGFRFENVALTQTVHKLAQAALTSAPDILEEARLALAALFKPSPQPPSGCPLPSRALPQHRPEP
jgi:hypothetical protein